MLNVLGLPKPQNGYIDYFYNTGYGGQFDGWQVWEKPSGISMIDITCIGGGGGGASGWARNTVSRVGGGGGGSSGITRVIISAIHLPDTLYVIAGLPGPGGDSSNQLLLANSGIGGGSSFVSIAPYDAAPYVICYANFGQGADVGSISGPSGFGVGGAIAVQSNARVSGLGQFFALAGQNGASNPTTGPGPAVTYPTAGLLLSGGAAGGGGLSAGGNVTAPTQSSFTLFTTRTGGAAGNPASAGADGLSLSQPLISIGGAGGGCSLSASGGVGGRGGNGGLGSGGGGGGAGGTNPDFAGGGGSGGPGIVIIQSY